MKSVPAWAGHYVPWIGDDFWSQSLWPGARLLVLGESHYFGEPEDERPETTCDRICEAITPDGNPWPYFRKLPEIIAGKTPLSVRGRADIWQSIAFENVVQEPADPKTRVPKAGAIARGKPALYQLISYLQPTHVLFVSKRLWDGTAYDEEFRGRSQGTFPVDGRRQPYDLHRGRVGSTTFWMTYILHPTNGHPPPPANHSSQVVKRLLAQRSEPTILS